MTGRRDRLAIRGEERALLPPARLPSAVLLHRGPPSVWVSAANAMRTRAACQCKRTRLRRRRTNLARAGAWKASRAAASPPASAGGFFALRVRLLAAWSCPVVPRAGSEALGGRDEGEGEFMPCSSAASRR